ncbi:MAG: hypothetical protein AB1468_03470 [Candidatus Micrarchaeota archaeon]
MSESRKISVILKGQAREEFEKLNEIVGEQTKRGETNSEEMQLLKSIKQKAEILKINPTYGEKIPQNLIPKQLDVSNLFKVNLTGYWRMLYTIEGNRIEIVVFVLWVIDHPAYDKMLGYKKK